MSSSERARLIEKVRPLLVTGDGVVIRSGLDYWFPQDAATAKVPVRWKQFLITWSAIFPLVTGVPLLVQPALDWLGVPSYRWLTMLILTGIIVFLMVYIVMPRYTRLVWRWLYR